MRKGCVMDNHKKTKVCAVTNCAQCSGYNLQYRYINIHLNEASLMDTLSLIYEYDQKDEFYKSQNLLSIKFGMAMVTVKYEDFDEFKNEVEAVVLANLVLPDLNLY